MDGSSKRLILMSVALKHSRGLWSENLKERNTQPMFKMIDQPNDRQGNSLTLFEDRSQKKSPGRLGSGHNITLFDYFIIIPLEVFAPSQQKT